jgi:hypothetical protein
MDIALILCSSVETIVREFINLMVILLRQYCRELHQEDNQEQQLQLESHHVVNSEGRQSRQNVIEVDIVNSDGKQSGQNGIEVVTTYNLRKCWNDGTTMVPRTVERGSMEQRQKIGPNYTSYLV